ncbi:uncharacterized protein LOC130828994 isoform X3 [Hippopotamus amphibius kiboko]|nr:uncharacterized protein LOC130828994 isoform X3 [Hippopotamus amphibius kiboko]XP_057551063.1 uncharacterized protein LOC130828994 isoform X3 [Hippopotamus amphibius kiboko]
MNPVPIKEKQTQDRGTQISKHVCFTKTRGTDTRSDRNRTRTKAHLLPSPHEKNMRQNSSFHNSFNSSVLGGFLVMSNIPLKPPKCCGIITHPSTLSWQGHHQKSKALIKRQRSFPPPSLGSALMWLLWGDAGGVPLPAFASGHVIGMAFFFNLLK